MQKLAILLTKLDGSPIIVGVESIINVTSEVHHNIKDDNGNSLVYSKIQSRGAMVETFRVQEGVIDIYDLINSN